MDLRKLVNDGLSIDQIKWVVTGIKRGLTDEQLAVYARPDISEKIATACRYGFYSQLPIDVVIELRDECMTKGSNMTVQVQNRVAMFKLTGNYQK